MKRFLVMALLSVSCTQASAQVFTLSREAMVRYTAKNPYERFEDGRPKAPDAVLAKLKDLSAEDVFGVLSGARFTNQFEGGWKLLHPERKLIGRAVTAQFMPFRPDLSEVLEADAKARGLGANANQRVIDSLLPSDVLVVDLFGKIENGTYVGDNLATAIFASTGNGFVVDGAVRDLEGIFPLGNMFRESQI